MNQLVTLVNISIVIAVLQQARVPQKKLAVSTFSPPTAATAGSKESINNHREL